MSEVVRLVRVLTWVKWLSAFGEVLQGVEETVSGRPRYAPKRHAARSGDDGQRTPRSELQWHPRRYEPSEPTPPHDLPTPVSALAGHQSTASAQVNARHPPTNWSSDPGRVGRLGQASGVVSSATVSRDTARCVPAVSSPRRTTAETGAGRHRRGPSGARPDAAACHASSSDSRRQSGRYAPTALGSRS